MNVTALTAPAAGGNWKRVGWILLLLGGLFAASNAIMFMLVGGHGSPEIKERFFATAIAGWSHAFGGAIAPDRAVPADNARAHVLAHGAQVVGANLSAGRARRRIGRLVLRACQLGRHCWTRGLRDARGVLALQRHACVPGN